MVIAKLNPRNPGSEKKILWNFEVHGKSYVTLNWFFNLQYWYALAIYTASILINRVTMTTNMLLFVNFERWSI